MDFVLYLERASDPVSRAENLCPKIINVYQMNHKYWIKHLKHKGRIMSSYVLFLLLLTFIPMTGSYACDICGCSVGGNYFGILPQFQKTFAGLRYQYRGYESEHLTLFPDEVPLKTTERFHTTELWARYVPNERLHLFAFVPYNYYTKEESGQRTAVSGLGDISLMAHYILINTGDQSGKSWKQALQAGGGIKLPTGTADHVEQSTGLIIPSMQTGTGAIDIPLSALYTLRHREWGMSAEVNYRINTRNKNGYTFGDRLAASARIFYWKKACNYSLLPYTGAGYEYGFRDRKYGERQEYTGSRILLWNAGTDLYYKKAILNLGIQVPVHQDIAQGQIHGGLRCTAGLSFLL